LNRSSCALTAPHLTGRDATRTLNGGAEPVAPRAHGHAPDRPGRGV